MSGRPQLALPGARRAEQSLEAVEDELQPEPEVHAPIVRAVRHLLGRFALVVASWPARGPERAADFESLLQLVAANQLTVVLDRTFPLEHLADAYWLVDSGHKRGNVIVRP